MVTDRPMMMMILKLLVSLKENNCQVMAFQRCNFGCRLLVFFNNLSKVYLLPGNFSVLLAFVPTIHIRLLYFYSIVVLMLFIRNFLCRIL